MMNNTPTPLGEDFFHRDCLDVAPDLVGKLIIRNTDEGEIRLRISGSAARSAIEIPTVATEAITAAANCGNAGRRALHRTPERQKR